MANEQLRALRLDHNLTQDALAEQVCEQIRHDTGRPGSVDAQALSRMERGETAWPGADTRRALRTILGVDTDADLGFAARRTRQDAERVDATKRRNFIALAGLGLADPPARRIGLSDVERLRTRFGRMRDLDNIAGGADTFRLYFTELARTEHVLAKGSFDSARTGVALADLASEQAQQAGWAAFDAGFSKVSLDLFAYSHRTSTEAGNAGLVANALVHTAYVDKSPRAKEAADLACRILRAAAPARARALLESRRAWSHAVDGDALQAGRALDRARDALDHDDGSSAPDWSVWMNTTELDIMAGRVWTVLHRPRQAVPVLDRVLSDYPDAWARDKALYLLHLADALTDAGDADRAVTVVTNAVDLAAGVASVRPIAHATATTARLQRLGAPNVDRLAEHLAAVSRTPPVEL